MNLIRKIMGKKAIVTFGHSLIQLLKIMVNQTKRNEKETKNVPHYSIDCIVNKII